ncbi:hypothetical protein MM236_08245 [Belliella sp. DSM 107340]|uniref:Uncharacterized protein n=1 Tax=Belliella calami TaxID=2923436 RepID=A0ABS9UMY8_9BACT|nr:hypothetical protein [Belliella calami]MCH7397976.1 hypothetical protein [Belliella calami]
MIKYYFKVGFGIFLYAYATLHVSAQNQLPMALYTNSIPMTPEIFNGGEYVEYPSVFLGHAFFQTNSYTYADIVFNGIVYRDVPALYELVSQNIVVLNPTHAKKVMIQSNKVSEFILKSELGAVRFVKGQLIGNNQDYKERFLEEVVPNGLFAFHRKSVQREIKGLERNSRFDSYENFILLHDKDLIDIKGKNEIIGILGLDKKSTRKMLKEKGVKYRKSNRTYHTAIVQFYKNNLGNE